MAKRFPRHKLGWRDHAAHGVVAAALALAAWSVHEKDRPVLVVAMAPLACGLLAWTAGDALNMAALRRAGLRSGMAGALLGVFLFGGFCLSGGSGDGLDWGSCALGAAFSGALAFRIYRRREFEFLKTLGKDAFWALLILFCSGTVGEALLSALPYRARQWLPGAGSAGYSLIFFGLCFLAAMSDLAYKAAVQHLLAKGYSDETGADFRWLWLRLGAPIFRRVPTWEELAVVPGHQGRTQGETLEYILTQTGEPLGVFRPD